MTDHSREYLLLSGIQHFAFCRRQWALAYIEQQWEENDRTVDGRLMHRRAHDADFRETRNGVIIRRGMPIKSDQMCVRGVCDIVEFIPDDSGITLPNHSGHYRVEPVEYKRGSSKQGDEDILQVTAQAMCLEEMLCCQITRGYLYYGALRRREPVVITDELRDKVRKLFQEMHRYVERGYTPKPKRSKSCNACSLANLCLPKLEKNYSVNQYIENKISDDKD